MLFRNYYRCANCGGEWSDVWSAQCDDDCPHCGARHMSPYESEDVEEREAADLLDAGARERAARIRRLNDAFRTTFGGGQVVMTSTVAALPEMVRAHALVAVARFDAFDGSNDPYQEHDFGAADQNGAERNCPCQRGIYEDNQTARSAS